MGSRTPALARVPVEWRVLGWLGVFTLLYRVFYDQMVVVLVFAVAFLLAAVLHPTVTWMNERAHIPRVLSAFLLMGGLVGVTIGVGYWALPPIVQQASQLGRAVPELHEQLGRPFANLARRYPSWERWLLSGSQVIQVQRWVMPLISGIQTYAAVLGQVLVGAALVVVAALYTLVAPVSLASGLIQLWPAEERARVAQGVNAAMARVRRWIGAQVIAMLTVGILSGLAVWLLGLPFAALFGVFAGLLEIVPALGPFLGAVGPVLAALAIEPTRALWVVVAFTAIQQLENNVLIPLIIGSSLRIHPVPILFVIFVMGGLFGMLGVFLAVPTMAVAQAVYEESRQPPPEQREHAEKEARAALEMTEAEEPEQGEPEQRAA